MYFLTKINWFIEIIITSLTEELFNLKIKIKIRIILIIKENKERKKYDWRKWFSNVSKKSECNII